ncbi:MAG: hypothetical protein HC857_13570 [Synechococcales cyanobacterium RU_4_20]|nr:hypothetical protein [Synechococcales cyanobacterium RU_4_20]NJR71295.1 hypothetical protein [Synechococcales cyanobacterium CRU_2_2]
MTQSTETQVAAITENVRHNEKSIDLLRSDAKEIKGDIKQLNQAVASLDTKVDQLETDVKELKGDVKEAKNDIKQLYHKVANLDTKFTVGFIILSALIVFQDQITSLLALVQVAR